MGILSEYMMKEAVSAFVDKDEREAIAEFVTYSVQSTQEYLKKSRATEENIGQQLTMRKRHMQREEEEKLVAEVHTGICSVVLRIAGNLLLSSCLFG